MQKQMAKRMSGWEEVEDPAAGSRGRDYWYSD
jgi:hypothetical protein